MKLENQVCSLKLAKKLRKLGVKQDSLWEWVALPPQEDPPSKSDYILTLSFSKTLKAEKWCFSAFTVAELGEMLPVIWGELLLGNDGNSLIRIYKNMGDDMLVNWTVIYDTQGRTPFVKRGEKVKKGLFHQEDGENLAKVLAKMLIYLKENKLI